MLNEKEARMFELEMYETMMDSCSCQNRSGSCSEYNEDYCVFEDNQSECLKYRSIREKKEFFRSGRRD